MDVLGWVVAAGSSLITAVLYPFILHRLKKMDDKRDQAHEDRKKEKAQELAQIQANSEGMKMKEEIMNLQIRTDLHPVNPFITLLKKSADSQE